MRSRPVTLSPVPKTPSRSPVRWGFGSGDARGSFPEGVPLRYPWEQSQK